MSEYIEHEGTVKRINGNKIIVSLIQTSACNKCDSKTACTLGLSEVKEKEIEIEANPSEYPIGTKVMIKMKFSIGTLAVFLSYILPIFLLIIVVVLFYNITKNDGITGLLGILFLMLYFAILYFFKGKLEKKVKFTIEKIN
jgi:sigma-E factor negative regulatory protein RseC